MTEEALRLQRARDGSEPWRKWGPYLSERAWGTVREDYSPDGAAWDYFPHDHARSRAYRWSEDGLAGISDQNQRLCFALALWNGADPILKERLFGLTGPEGNHAEDVKEAYYYLDSTPTHSYMRWLYKYPQRAFPYRELVEESRRRGKEDPEYELLDTGIFAGDRYFDVEVEYAKAAPEDVLIRITATNRGPEPAPLVLLPTLWFRNIWSWGEGNPRHRLRRVSGPLLQVRADHPRLGTFWLHCPAQEDGPELLFTENDTNQERLWPGARNETPYVKDGIDRYVVHGDREAVNPEEVGSKVAACYRWTLAPGETRALRLRLAPQETVPGALEAPFEDVFTLRRQEADGFYAAVAPAAISEDARNVQRQAFAGLLWSKQYYRYDVRKWLLGDPAGPRPPESRFEGRNRNWKHLNSATVFSMPDKWEYPWFAAWDLAFHCLPLALVDPDFAKEQLLVLLREWHMAANGQIPAYEWAFGDVNPPVHAWAVRRVYQIDRRLTGEGDVKFLERAFHKLLLNFTWWVNRKDSEGRNLFQGGFLGLDNIGLFDRSAPLPGGGTLSQSDGTGWMAMYCLNMLAIALELARCDDTYEDVASKFLEHFFYIAYAMNDRPALCGDDGIDLWDEVDGFYYDLLHLPHQPDQFLRVRSMVGLVPLLAVETVDAELLDRLPGFRARMEWFLHHRRDLSGDAASLTETGVGERRLFSVVNAERLRSILVRMLDEREFLSPYGLRSVSRYHLEHPYTLRIDGGTYRVAYEPGESRTELFGGNSNWRGPIWFPLNYLIIEALQKLDHYYGGEFTVECPTGSGRHLSLWGVASELSRRLTRLFLRDASGRRPLFGDCETLQTDPHWRDHLLFPEYFHGETGAGLGAMHQTGWTALVAKLIQQVGG